MYVYVKIKVFINYVKRRFCLPVDFLFFIEQFLKEKRIEIKLNSIEMPNWIRVLLYIKKEKKYQTFSSFGIRMS